MWNSSTDMNMSAASTKPTPVHNCSMPQRLRKKTSLAATAVLAFHLSCIPSLEGVGGAIFAHGASPRLRDPVLPASGGAAGGSHEFQPRAPDQGDDQLQALHSHGLWDSHLLPDLARVTDLARLSQVSARTVGKSARRRLQGLCEEVRRGIAEGVVTNWARDVPREVWGCKPVVKAALDRLLAFWLAETETARQQMRDFQFTRQDWDKLPEHITDGLDFELVQYRQFMFELYDKTNLLDEDTWKREPPFSGEQQEFIDDCKKSIRSGHLWDWEKEIPAPLKRRKDVVIAALEARARRPGPGSSWSFTLDDWHQLDSAVKEDPEVVQLAIATGLLPNDDGPTSADTSPVYTAALGLASPSPGATTSSEDHLPLHGLSAPGEIYTVDSWRKILNEMPRVGLYPPAVCKAIRDGGLTDWERDIPLALRNDKKVLAAWRECKS